MGDLLLIRHGQASFGAEDYDRLSPVGETQSQRLGAWLRGNEPAPVLVARGNLRRHAQTVQRCLDAAGVDAPILTFAGLDELDHVELLRRHRPDLPDQAALAAEMRRHDDPRRAFQSLFAAAVERWTSGSHDGEYHRSWSQFRDETLRDLHALTEQALERDGDVWVITSGGPIAVIAAQLLAVPVERTFTLSWPLVNTGITRVRPGRSRHQLVTYNAWPHLAGATHTDLLTHR
ncbi:histidine phosphatase family protein [Dyella sp.]|jgi:broad specificity phosphatase PhoE|uniref:histidine phosphatase family protein n=1 Tax=Dyella sp. TaxID=1869338 RepID=UPI002D79CF7F|nr:histidine phosphatase family protein [Dyella sp.]HET6431308.1 histidine phosphatase family protein [Dyella sp.]